jgi:ComF family protein
MILNKIVQAFRNAVFPARCMACRTLFVRPEAESVRPGKGEETFRSLMTPFLCEDCLTDVRRIESPICPRCGVMFRERVSDDHLCGDCLTSPGKVEKARAFGVYEKSLMHVIRSYKYRGKIQLAGPLGRLLFQLYRSCYGPNGEPDAPPDLIMPVPLHLRRFRERGFNQAFLMLKEWPDFFAEYSGKTPRISKDGFLRKKKTRPQAGLDRKGRRDNTKGAFTLSKSMDVSGKHVLLVDDVYTTGATVEECARVLVSGGAARVDVLTLARVL